MPPGRRSRRSASSPLGSRRRASRRRSADPTSRHVPGPPKRFAQAIGLGFTSLASLAWVLDAPTVSWILIAMLATAATLEAVFAVCLGCIAYSAIWGCADCNDISARLRQALVEARLDVDDAPEIMSGVADAPEIMSAVADAPEIMSAVADAPGSCRPWLTPRPCTEAGSDRGQRAMARHTPPHAPSIGDVGR